MNYQSKDVKRSIRNFKRKVDNLVNAGHHIYQTRVNELVNLINDDEVIRSIVGPYLEIDINFDEIENERAGWFNLKLPEDETLQIAYVLQILNKSKEGEFQIDMYAHNIFRHQNLNHNISEWNNQILIPCLHILIDKLSDLIEDQVEGKEVVSSSSLKIVNYGNITAKQGNVGIGNNIEQSINLDNISEVIVNKAIEKEIIGEDKIEETKEVANELEIELKKDFPSQTVLKSIVESFYNIGKKALVSLIVNMISNPDFTLAVVNFFSN